MNSGFVSRSLAVGLYAGSLFKQTSTKFLYSGDQSSLTERVGGGECSITMSTRIGWRSEFGASPFASSIAVIPRDQMSALKSYPFAYSMTSGAIQHGEPTKVILLCPALI